jgi:hypothetical protein
MSEDFNSQRRQKLYQSSARALGAIWERRWQILKMGMYSDIDGSVADFILKMEDMLLRWEGIHIPERGKLRYVAISPLSSGIITRSYECQTALFDREPFVEENPLCFYWTPKFIYQDMEADMQDFREMVSRDMIRLREDEVEEIRRKYALCHAYTTMLFLDGIFKEIKKLPFWKRIAGRDAKVLYGTYMEKMVEIGKEETAVE